VINSANPNDVSVVTAGLREEAGFIAGWLSAAPGGEQRIQERLGLTGMALHRLLTCRAPRPQSFLADVSAIAEYVGVDPTALATSLREATVLTTPGGSEAHSRGRAAGATVDVVAAARDTVPDQLPVAVGTANVRELAEATWQAAPAYVRKKRDVQAAVIWASQVVVVLLPQLHLTLVNRWLVERNVPPLEDGPDDLRGLLVAWRGQAAIFVDGALPESDRIFTVAHEHGHLLLDYLIPRRRVLRDAPDLLDVVDGHRVPSKADHARAALARLPLGMHTHLLHRDADGGTADAAARAEDQASTYALELLAPWEELLKLLRARLPQDGAYSRRLGAAVEAVADVFELPRNADEVRATAGLTALGIHPSFFDR
jgi:hypothetical protein